MKLVSVIIPAYNAAAFIDQTIKSVQRQTWPDLEIIIVNDGSTDGTLEAIRRLASADNRIKIIDQVNLGCSAAKSAGLKAALGEYIQYMDADDLLSPNKISEQVEGLLQENADLAVCRTVVFSDRIDEEGVSELDSDFLYTTDDSMEFVLNLYGKNGKFGMIQPNAFLLSRPLVDRIGDWNTSISPSPDEDGEYFCRALLASGKIYFSQTGINYYRKKKAADSLSKKVDYRHAKGGFASVKLIVGHLLAKDNSAVVRKVASKKTADFIYGYAVHYNDLLEESIRFWRQIGYSKVSGVGGRTFRMVNSILGYSNAIRLRRRLEVNNKTKII